MGTHGFGARSTTLAFVLGGMTFPGSQRPAQPLLFAAVVNLGSSSTVLGGEIAWVRI